MVDDARGLCSSVMGETKNLIFADPFPLLPFYSRPRQLNLTKYNRMIGKHKGLKTISFSRERNMLPLLDGPCATNTTTGAYTDGSSSSSSHSTTTAPYTAHSTRSRISWTHASKGEEGVDENDPRLLSPSAVNGDPSYLRTRCSGRISWTILSFRI